MGFYGRRLIPEPLLRELLKNRYTHYVTLLDDEQTFVIQIKNGSKADLTSNDIKAFISSLPDGAIYPVSQTGFDSHYGAVLLFIHGIMNNSGTNQIVHSTLYADIQDNKIQVDTNNYSSVFGDYTIVSQYVL